MTKLFVVNARRWLCDLKFQFIPTDTFLFYFLILRLYAWSLRFINIYGIIGRIRVFVSHLALYFVKQNVAAFNIRPSIGIVSPNRFAAL